jgi:hypothetical protein
MREKRNVYRILVGKPEGKIDQWEDLDADGSVIHVLKRIRWGGMDWTVLDQGRNQWRALVKTVMNLRVP